MRKALFFILAVLLVVLVIGLLTGVVLAIGPLKVAYFLLYCLGGLVFLALFVWFALAPLNIFFTFVEEGTAKVVVRGKAVQRVFIQWDGYILDRHGDVVTGRQWYPFGGLRLFGWWPFDQIYRYKSRWTSIHADGTKQAHDDDLDHVLLKDFVYVAEVKDAEDKEMVPLTFDLLITLRVINPQKALFIVEDWTELVFNRIKPLFREFTANHTFAELTAEKQAVRHTPSSPSGRQIVVWDELGISGIIQEFEDDYGIHIKEGGIEMKDISPREEYQKAATQKYLAERTAERRAVETVGTVLEAMAHSRGKTPKEMQALIDTSPELQREFLDSAKDFLSRAMAIEGKSFVDIRVGGAGGVEAFFLDLLAAGKRMPTGGGQDGPRKEPNKKKLGSWKEELDKLDKQEQEEEEEEEEGQST